MAWWWCGSSLLPCSAGDFFDLGVVKGFVELVEGHADAHFQRFKVCRFGLAMPFLGSL